MNNILKNKWVGIILPCFSLLYLLVLIYITVNAFLYRFIIDDKILFGIVYGLINIIFLSAMFLTRKSKVTTISSYFILLLCFFLLIFDFGNMLLFIPPFIVAIVMFFSCRGKETLKTVLGTIYLLIYVLGIVAYVLVNNFFGSRIEGKILKESMPEGSSIMTLYTQQRIDQVTTDNISADGKYRFYLVDIDNKMNGEIQLIVEPNHLDKKMVIFTLKEKGRNKVVGYTKSRGDAALPAVKWVENNKIQYQFPGQPVKNSVIKETDLEKDYFSFLYSD